MNPEITATEAAALAGVSVQSVSAWIRAGKLPARRDGRNVLIPRPALEALLHRTCARCGAPFTPRRPTRGPVYCGDPCRWAATVAKRKAANPATRGPGRPPRHLSIDPRPPGPVPERLAAALAATRKGKPPG